ncbi:MAG: thioredoxin family protein [Sulfurimonas sp.]|jgi:thioredoxin-like negative regulator of GroEL|uniref:thioredoxin family protein n=1 Tax=unclassified Sulfurimonas TaxID=2623549 RepID=UPI0008BB102C|nr:thioredoxin family protein [Sulfurimonas sp. RIFOXYB12_FULL_35_9]MBS4067376.1 thioredoxin family protein [Sulfurimonas sp.]OHE03739.1 MAG: thiol reductase thioredoxin [Sulfurimonas sp. RIFOXYB12_FULL_35_9]OHE11923.1 MAG: thiol reductase thioredoxin [Sulfurimonas sp. RIFOXYC2_FULL_36_7]OHE16520.1 MAG: thiol reductase thioredoxin [Sulfurimonas sp. RIFOXYD2_FULL_37_8]
MQNIEDIKKNINENLAVMLYFSAPTCNVCHALKPKLVGAIEDNFKEFKIVNIDTSIEQETAAYFSVFAIPTVLIFLDGKEFLRKSRHMSIDEIIREIKRPYEIMNS